MKKILAVALSLVFLLTAAIPAFAVDTPSRQKQVAIIVPGVIESNLLINEEPNFSRRFYDPAADLLRNTDIIKDMAVAVMKALFLLQYDSLDEVTCRFIDAGLGVLAMNPDGTSAHSIRPVVSGADECSLAAMQASGKWEDVDYGAMIALELAEHIGAENVFVFCYDWRLGSTELADGLRDFIADVKRAAGVEKVNLYGNSYGCQVVAKYLYEYGGGSDVDNVVFNAPAWTGTSIFKGLMADSKADIEFNIEAGARVLLRFFGTELTLEHLTKLIPNRIVKHVAYTALQHTMNEYLLYSPGLWSCCSTRDYEEMKAKLLDPEKDAAFIALVDEAQYGIMSHIPEMLQKAQNDGISVAITMSDGTPLFAGRNINGDGVVDVESASGGQGVPFGCTFTDGRTGVHVSPNNTLDLTNGFLPDRTWVTTGQIHGQSYWDDTTRELIPKLLLTDEIQSVFSDPAFPQFLDTHCPADDVSIRMIGSADKTLHPADGKVKVILRNDSEQSSVFIAGVTVSGLPYIASPTVGLLKPGETRTVTLTPLSKDASPKYGSIQIHYFDNGMLPLGKSRTQAFKIG